MDGSSHTWPDLQHNKVTQTDRAVVYFIYKDAGFFPNVQEKHCHNSSLKTPIPNAT